MFLTSDYHTHTVFSHGKGKIIDNAMVAKQKGLKEVGISDHGFSHPAFGLTKSKLPKMRALCQQASQISGVKVLLGIESNVIGTDGTVDLKEKYYDDFDIFLAGIHKFVLYKFKTIFSLAIPDLYHTYFQKKNIPQRVVKENTKTFVNVIKNNPVDIITHLNFCCFADAVEVAKVASDYGTYIELNSKKSHLTDQEICDIIAKTKANFILNSDAHTPDRVGEISLAQGIIERLNIPLDRIVNIDGKLPVMRFASFKGREQ